MFVIAVPQITAPATGYTTGTIVLLLTPSTRLWLGQRIGEKSCVILLVNSLCARASLISDLLRVTTPERLLIFSRKSRFRRLFLPVFNLTGNAM